MVSAVTQYQAAGPAPGLKLSQRGALLVAALVLSGSPASSRKRQRMEAVN